MKQYEGTIIQIMKSPVPLFAVFFQFDQPGHIFKQKVDICYLTSDGYIGYLGYPIGEKFNYTEDPYDSYNFIGYEYCDEAIDWTGEVNKLIEKENRK